MPVSEERFISSDILIRLFPHCQIKFILLWIMYKALFDLYIICKALFELALSISFQPDHFLFFFLCFALEMTFLRTLLWYMIEGENNSTLAILNLSVIRTLSIPSFIYLFTHSLTTCLLSIYWTRASRVHGQQRAVNAGLELQSRSKLVRGTPIHIATYMSDSKMMPQKGVRLTQEKRGLKQGQTQWENDRQGAESKRNLKRRLRNAQS